MKLSQLAYFREIVRCQNFTKAADNLYIAQSALSHSVRALEDELGVSLLVRERGRKVEVTEYGKVLYDYAERILGDVDEVRDTINAMHSPDGGIVKIIYSMVNGFVVIPRAIKALKEDPGCKDIIVRIDINHGEQKIEEELQQSVYDIGFTSIGSYPGLNSAPIYKQQMFVALSTDHPLAGREFLTVHDIAEEPLIIYHRGRHTHNLILRMFREENIVPNIEEYYADWAMQMSAVALGEGVAIVQNLPHDEELVKLIPLQHPLLASRYVYMHWPANTQPTAAAKKTMNYLDRYFRNLNPDLPPSQIDFRIK